MIFYNQAPKHVIACYPLEFLRYFTKGGVVVLCIFKSLLMAGNSCGVNEAKNSIITLPSPFISINALREI